MKISELIVKLKSTQDELGDVHVYHREVVNRIQAVNILTDVTVANYVARVGPFVVLHSSAELCSSFRRRVRDLERFWQGISGGDWCNLAFSSNLRRN